MLDKHVGKQKHHVVDPKFFNGSIGRPERTKPAGGVDDVLHFATSSEKLNMLFKSPEIKTHFSTDFLTKCGLLAVWRPEKPLEGTQRHTETLENM
jgi:hypothetical protein